MNGSAGSTFYAFVLVPCRACLALGCRLCGDRGHLVDRLGPYHFPAAGQTDRPTVFGWLTREDCSCEHTTDPEDPDDD